MQTLKQTWWSPLGWVLVLAQVGVALAFIFGEGTSNILDAEGKTAGIALSLGGAAALAAGLWVRPRARALGNLLIIIGSALGAIWFWNVLMTPIAIAVIVGVVVTQVRSTTPTETP